MSTTDQRNLRYFLTQVRGSIDLPVDGGIVRRLDLSAPLPANTEFVFNAIRQQHDGIHCGDLSVRNILEIIRTGDPNINPMTREQAAELRRGLFPGITTAPGVDAEGDNSFESKLSQKLLEHQCLVRSPGELLEAPNWTMKTRKAFPCSAALVPFFAGAFPCSVALVFFLPERSHAAWRSFYNF